LTTTGKTLVLRPDEMTMFFFPPFFSEDIFKFAISWYTHDVDAFDRWRMAFFLSLFDSWLLTRFEMSMLWEEVLLLLL
jgi:hypothetical protein